MSSKPAVFQQTPVPLVGWQEWHQENPFASQATAPAVGTVQICGGAIPAGFFENGNSALAGAGQSQPRPNPRLIREQLDQLQRFYAMVSSDRLIAGMLQDVPVLFSLLKDAVEPLSIAFGNNKVLKLEAVEAPDEGSILRVTVRLPAGTAGPTELMRGFKRNWWLSRCVRSQASLVFDYEIGNGF